MSTQFAQFYMPARGEWSAPSFNKSKPRELVRFFKELERLFVRASVTSEEEKKEQVLRYVDFEVEEFWQTLPEYKSSLATYNDFKATILSHYPDASGDYTYSLCDLDSLIREQQQVGINNATDLANFHLQFHMITSWLIDKSHICHLEQRRAYIRAFPPHLMSLIDNRLRIKFPDLHPNIPYSIRDVYEAAQYILYKATTRTRNYFAPVPASPATAPSVLATPDSSLISENLQTIFADLSKTLVDLLSQDSQRMERPSFNRSPHSPNRPPATVLPHATDVASSDANILSPDDRIAQLEAELHALRASERSLIHPVHNRAEKARSAHTEDSDSNDEVLEKVPKKEIASNVKAQAAQPQETKRKFNNDLVAPPFISSPQQTIPNRIDPKLEHPFWEAKAIAYTPPTDRNIGAPISPVRKKSAPAYKALLSVHKTPIASDIQVQLKDTQNAITQRQLLPLIPETSAQTQEITATCKELSREEAHLFQNCFQFDSNEATNLSTCPVVEALTSPSSTLVSDLSATPATSVGISKERLRLDDSSFFPSLSVTSLEYPDRISLRNTPETSLSDPHATSDGTCDPSDSFSDPAIAIIPETSATLNAHSKQSGSCTISNKHIISSDYCDPSNSEYNTATSAATTTLRNHCNFGDLGLNFAENLATSQMPVISNQADKLPSSRDVCDPFRNIPTLDPQLAPYMPTSCYKQDRKENFLQKNNLISSLCFARIPCILIIFVCLYIVACRIFDKKRSLGDFTMLCTCSHSLKSHALHTRSNWSHQHSSQAIIVRLAIPSILRQSVARLVSFSDHISHSRSHSGYIGRIRPQKSDYPVISQYLTHSHLSCNLAKEDRSQLHLQSHLSKLARISLYLVAIWTPHFGITQRTCTTWFATILWVTHSLLLVFPTCYQHLYERSPSFSHQSPCYP